MPGESERLHESSAAVHAHLSILQAVIQRMGSNSASCKAWCIALASGVLVVVADQSKPQYAWIAVIPTLLFLVLDAYYLGLERAFRRSYNNFIETLHFERLRPDDLYAVVPAGSVLRHFGRALLSFSVWPFYSTLLAMIYLAAILVL